MEHADLSEPPAVALVVVAHPDDIDFGMSGTVAALVAAGTHVHYAIATSGEAGPPEDADRDELAATRQREQREAAAAVGVDDVRFLGQPDGHLEANLELRKVISRVVRQVRPDLVLCQAPVRRWDRIYASHPDHLAVAAATMCAVYPDARNPHAHVELLAEGFEPHAVAQTWVVGLPRPDHFVDITDVFDRKVKALSSHASQVAWIDDVDAFLRGWATDVSAAHGLPEGTLTEAWTKIDTL